MQKSGRSELGQLLFQGTITKSPYLQKPHRQNGCSWGGGGPEQPRGHCNSVLNIEDKRGLDGVIVFLFSLLLLLLLLLWWSSSSSSLLLSPRVELRDLGGSQSAR